MSVLFAVRNDGADCYYRGTAPASMLRASGYDAEARVATVQDADEFDALVLLRHADPVAEIVCDEFHQRGKPVIYDCDDWLFGIPPSSYFYGHYFQRGLGKPRDTLAYHERLLRKADLVTTTTEYLAEKLRAYNEYVEVVPNCVLWSDWDLLAPLERATDGPVVGWVGLPYHWNTWLELAPVLEEPICDHKATLVVIGYPEVVTLFSEHLASRTRVQPMVPFNQFEAIRRMMTTFDVGLAWLSPRLEYNLCKSPLRALQYGAAGVPVVASEHVYGDVLFSERHEGYLGVPCQRVESVSWGIDLLLKDRVKAHNLAEEWKLEVFREHSYETQYRRWLEVLNRMELCYGPATEPAA